MSEPLENEADLAEWLARFEAFYVDARGAGLLLSPYDREVATAWWQARVPLGVAMRVVEERFAEYRFVRGPAARPPVSLRYFDEAVREAAAASRGHAGTGALALGDCVAASLEGLRDSLVPVGLSAADPRAVTAYRAAWRRLMGWIEAPQTAPSIEEAVMRLRRTLVASFATQLDDTARAQVRVEVERRLGSERGLEAASERARNAMRRAVLEDVLATRYDVRFPTPWGWARPPDGPT